jgi:hypothetical protein
MFGCAAHGGASLVVPLTLLSFLPGCGDGGGGGTGPEIPAVNSVEVSPADASMQVGGQVQLTATPRDANGAPLTGRAVTWSSSSGAVAVSAAGVVTASAAGGPATITATSDGKRGTAQITVGTRVATQVTTTPDFATVSVGATTQLTVDALDAAGAPVPNPPIAWSSLSATTASVAGAGSTTPVSGVAPGVTRIAARVNNAADTSLIAVLGPRSLLSTNFAEGRYSVTVARGQLVSVPVVLDVSRASANGDLGSIQFDLLYNTSLLAYRSAVVGANGSATVDVSSPGTFRFRFTGTAPQGRSNLTLVTVTFQVPQTAPLANTVLVLNYTAAPTSTSNQPFELPIAAWGRLRVAQ